ncbi:MAG: hypothetical protein U0470_08120 [Anaerolineae bacterium]
MIAAIASPPASGPISPYRFVAATMLAYSTAIPAAASPPATDRERRRSHSAAPSITSPAITPTTTRASGPK